MWEKIWWFPILCAFMENSIVSVHTNRKKEKNKTKRKKSCVKNVVVFYSAKVIPKWYLYKRARLRKRRRQFSHIIKKRILSNVRKMLCISMKSLLQLLIFISLSIVVTQSMASLNDNTLDTHTLTDESEYNESHRQGRCKLNSFYSVFFFSFFVLNWKEHWISSFN